MRSAFETGCLPFALQSLTFGIGPVTFLADRSLSTAPVDVCRLIRAG